MIKANELRIGNWVNEFGDTVIIEKGEEIDSHHQNFEPIPITPEILEKAGFVKDGFNCYNRCISWWSETQLKQLSFSGDYLYIREGELKENRIKDSIVVLWNKDLHKERFALHQLQNLYFALTGTELEINL